MVVVDHSLRGLLESSSLMVYISNLELIFHALVNLRHSSLNYSEL